MSQIKPTGTLRQKLPRQRDEHHLKAVRQCDCLTCGSPAPNEAAHIRYGNMRLGKFHTGMQEKPSDMWTLPLCATCHRTGQSAQHSMNERAFWKMHNIDPLDVAMRLFACNTDAAAMNSIVNEILTFARMK